MDKSEWKHLRHRERFVYALQQEIADDCGNWQLGQNPLKAGINEITLRLTPEQFTKLFSAVMAGAEIVYPYESHQVVWYLWGAVECANSIQLENCNDCVEEEDDMGKLAVQIINGQAFLRDDCDCNEPAYYELTKVSINPVTGLPQPSSGGGASGYWGDIVTDETNGDCYVDAAVDYLLDRAKRYALALNQWVYAGVDAIQPLDELLEIGRLIATLFTGVEYKDFGEVSDASIEAAFADAGFIAAMKDRWLTSVGNGTVTRDGLRDWVLIAPPTVNGIVGMRSGLTAWVGWLSMYEVNTQLAELRAQCISEGYVPQDPVESYDYRSHFDFTLDSNGTGTGTGGWISGSGTGSVYTAGVGWGAGGGGNANDFKAVIRNTSFAANVTAMRIWLDGNMGGNLNRVYIHADVLAFELLEDDHTENPIPLTMAVDVASEIHVECQEYADASNSSDNFTKHISRIDFWGTGNKPAGSIDF